MSREVVGCAVCRCRIERGRTYRWVGIRQSVTRLVVHAFEVWPADDVSDFSECAWERLLPDLRPASLVV